MTQAAFDFSRFDAELELAKRMRQHGRGVFVGDTNPDQRRELFRKTIVDTQLEFVVCIARSPNGKCETYREFFERFYGEPLHPKAAKRKRA